MIMGFPVDAFREVASGQKAVIGLEIFTSLPHMIVMFMKERVSED
jgi:hypothetical protein